MIWSVPYSAVISIGGIQVTVINRIFQQVIKYSCQLFRIPMYTVQFSSTDSCTRIAIGGQRGIKFIGQLYEKVIKVYLFLFQYNLLKVIPGDFEKFVDQLFQPVGLVQCDMRISGLLFGRHVRGFIQKAEITDDRGQRCFSDHGQDR